MENCSIKVAQSIVREWFESFEWKENRAMAGKMVDLIIKYPESVVKGSLNELGLILKPNFLPSLKIIDDVLDKNRDKYLENERTIDMLDALRAPREGNKSEFCHFIKSIIVNMQSIQEGKINIDDHYFQQAEFFRSIGREADARELENYIKIKRAG